MVNKVLTAHFIEVCNFRNTNSKARNCGFKQSCPRQTRTKYNNHPKVLVAAMVALVAVILRRWLVESWLGKKRAKHLKVYPRRFAE